MGSKDTGSQMTENGPGPIWTFSADLAGKQNWKESVPTIEQPNSAQKFSAQEFLEALRPVITTKRFCEPFGLLESGRRVPPCSQTCRETPASSSRSVVKRMMEKLDGGNCQFLQFWGTAVKDCRRGGSSRFPKAAVN